MLALLAQKAISKFMSFMSRIITDNYIEKLNSIIEEFEMSDNFCSLLDFFTEEVQKDQNRKGNRNQKVFSVNDLHRIETINESEELKRIFAYTNMTIKAFTGQCLHIHINIDVSKETVENLTSLFTWEALVECLYDRETLDNEITFLKEETRRDLIMPSNNNGHAINQIFRNRQGQKHSLKLLKKVKQLPESTANNGLLLNLNTSAENSVSLSDFSVFPESVNTCVNYGDSLQDIYDRNDSILQNISTIISLFPGERGRNVWYHKFISENINAWNQFPEFNFSKVITITSGEKTPEALLEMQKQNKFQAEEIYTIFSFEL